MNFAGKLKTFFTKAPALSEEFFEDLSDLLIEGDLGAKEAFTLAESLQAQCKKEKIDQPEAARVLLANLLEEMLLTTSECGLTTSDTGGAATQDKALLTIPKGGLTVILLLGVNGVGKTTTAAKLASLYQAAGYKTVLAAADTFRAAAIDQLKIHGERLGIRVVAHQQGGDPAAVVYDAIEAAGTKGLVIVDTAGRMHTKSALVAELQKIDRIVESKASGARYVKYLALDATTGRNAYAQAEIFCEAVSPEAAILTKYDSTAKGGVVFSLASGLHLPVAYLCTGEQYGDIRPFDPRQFAKEFVSV